MPIIVPAILEKTKEAFAEKLALVTKILGVERIQVDFGDGIFVADKLLTASDMAALNPAFEWEAHLMVKEPKDFLDYQICGFKTIIVHYEGFKNSDGAKSALKEIKNLGLEAGLALNPDTNIALAAEFSNFADLFLIMGVVPGKQGQSFIPKTIHRITELRKLIPNAIIEVDGGVNLGNIKQISDAGADFVIGGSAVVGQENPAEAFEKLTAAAAAVIPSASDLSAEASAKAEGFLT